jgi:hypothetical protein
MGMPIHLRSAAAEKGAISFVADRSIKNSPNVGYGL